MRSAAPPPPVSRTPRHALLVLALLVAAPAAAHHDPLSRSQWRLISRDGVVGGTLIFRLGDIAPFVLGDERLPSMDSVGQRAAMDRAMRAAVPGMVQVRNDGSPCKGRVLRVEYRKGVEVGLTFECGRPLHAVEIELTVLERLPSDHRQLASFQADGDTLEATLARDSATWRWTGPGGDAPAAAATTAPPGAPLPFGAAVWLGLHHVLAGLDHVLFVVGLVLSARRARDLLLFTTVFTLAHSVTLALAALGVVSVPPTLAEPLIAGSLVVVSLASLRERPLEARGRRALAIMVGAFGLVHGLGFAGGLTELALDRGLVTALAGFNVGVELAQLLVAGASYALVVGLRGRPWYRPRVLVPASATIAVLGTVWVIQRLMAG